LLLAMPTHQAVQELSLAQVGCGDQIAVRIADAFQSGPAPDYVGALCKSGCPLGADRSSAMRPSDGRRATEMWNLSALSQANLVRLD
jgi:hypothetical protein